MTKNIIIQEGGLARALSAEKLRTNLVEGGTCLWVPEDSVKLGKKTVSENGTYTAADAGFYGFSQFTVRGVGTAKGRGADGNEYLVNQDGDSLVTTALPSSIKVVTPPANEYGVWQDGQQIDKAGMVVKGYLADGSEWGTVPIDEVSLEPASADFSKTSGSLIRRCSDFGVGPWPQPVCAAVGSVTTADGSKRFEYDGYIALLLRSDDSRSDTILCSDKPGKGRMGWQLNSDYPIWNTITVDTPYTYKGKTVYYNGTGSGGLTWTGLSGGRNAYTDGDKLSRAQAAWIILYGELEQTPNGQKITAAWPRVGDGKVLEAAFEILVAPGYGG